MSIKNIDCKEEVMDSSYKRIDSCAQCFSIWYSVCTLISFSEVLLEKCSENYNCSLSGSGPGFLKLGILNMYVW